MTPSSRWTGRLSGVIRTLGEVTDRPATAFGVDDVDVEVKRMQEQHGVRVIQEPVPMGPRTSPSSTTPAET